MDNKFHIGITMAGAVSAGAYTGGVMDYLFQVLDAWEEAKKTGDPSIPQHQVSIDLISGASAGGITGGMAALAIFMEDRNPVTRDKRKDEKHLSKNVFYNAWVNLLQDDMLPLLLNTSDLEKHNKIISLLNSEFIEKVAERTIVCLPHCSTAPPPYINPEMQLVLTLSNLDGFRYQLSFEGSTSHHVMTQHRDYAFFKLGDEYGGKGRIPLNLQKDIGLIELKQASTATGAFPVGLAYRKFIRKRKYITENPDLVVTEKEVAKLVLEEQDNFNEDEYITYNVDGGMLNNEPFDLTMKLMAAQKETKKEQTLTAQEINEEEINSIIQLETKENKFNSTIIMIDPFPSEDGEDDQKQKEDIDTFPYNLMQVMSRIYKCMRGELLFKGEEVVAAFKDDNFSRFMISPKRRTGDEQINGSKAIACGALDGFAGFFDKNFRRHDFFLGKANCQSFLRKHFKVKLENGMPVNPLFAEGYSSEAISKFKFQDGDERKALETNEKNPDDADWYIPIIPDLFKWDENYDEKAEPFPEYNMIRFDKYKLQIFERARKMIRTYSTTKKFRFIALGIFNLGVKKRMFNSLKKVVEKEFKEWKLVK